MSQPIPIPLESFDMGLSGVFATPVRKSGRITHSVRRTGKRVCRVLFPGPEPSELIRSVCLRRGTMLAWLLTSKLPTLKLWTGFPAGAELLGSETAGLLFIDLGVQRATLEHLPALPGDGFSFDGPGDPITVSEIRARIQTLDKQTGTGNLGGMLLAYALLRLEAVACLQLFKSVGETPLIDTIDSLVTHAIQTELGTKFMARSIRTQAGYCGMDGTMACSLLSHAAAYVSDIWEKIPDVQNQDLFGLMVDTNKSIMKEVGLASVRNPPHPSAFHCGQPLVFEMDDLDNPDQSPPRSGQ